MRRQNFDNRAVLWRRRDRTHRRDILSERQVQRRRMMPPQLLVLLLGLELLHRILDLTVSLSLSLQLCLLDLVLGLTLSMNLICLSRSLTRNQSQARSLVKVLRLQLNHRR